MENRDKKTETQKMLNQALRPQEPRPEFQLSLFDKLQAASIEAHAELDNFELKALANPQKVGRATKALLVIAAAGAVGAVTYKSPDKVRKVTRGRIDFQDRSFRELTGRKPKSKYENFGQTVKTLAQTEVFNKRKKSKTRLLKRR